MTYFAFYGDWPATVSQREMNEIPGRTNGILRTNRAKEQKLIGTKISKSIWSRQTVMLGIVWAAGPVLFRPAAAAVHPAHLVDTYSCQRRRQRGADRGRG